MSEYGPDIVTLTDDDGTEWQFEMLDTMEYEGANYVALIPALTGDELLEDADELVVLQAVTDESGEEFLEYIEDEDIFERVSALFMERLEDEWDFVDEDGNPI